MKIAAHPLVVAAALGLLGPGALEGTTDPESERGAHDRAPEPAVADRVEPSAPSLLGRIDETLFTVEAPSAEDLARVELQWKNLGKA